jgi:hypothetical protein
MELMLTSLGTLFLFRTPLLSSNLKLDRHIHWYERLWPLKRNGTIDTSSVLNNNTYYTNPGTSMTHIINGMAGNGESHVELAGERSNITVVLDPTHYGFSKLTVFNETMLKIQFVLGKDGSFGDELVLLKNSTSSGDASASQAMSGGVSIGADRFAGAGFASLVSFMTYFFF